MTQQMDDGECQKCAGDVTAYDKHATYQGRLWHEGCFVCSDCSCSLGNVLFTFSRDDRLLCAACYDSMYPDSCSKCGESIKLGDEKFVHGELHLHRGCFKCQNCDKSLNPNSYWSHEDQCYCETCYGDLFTEHCGHCNEKVMKDGIVYRDRSFHSDCFLCSACSLNLSDKRFYFRDERVYCQGCLVEKYSKQCLSCELFIKGFGDEKMMSSGDQHWHEKCFFCSKCQQSLVRSSFVLEDEALLCPGCAKSK